MSRKIQGGPSATPETRALVGEMQRHAFAVQLATPSPGEVERPYRISSISAPTLLISGAHDLPGFTEIATHLAATLPDATHQHLEWAGHLPALERPDLVAPLLLDFLRA